MRLYSGTTDQFLLDTTMNQIADKLKISFFNYFGYNPGESEVKSWQNSLRAMSQVIDYSNLHDHGVILEYQLPMTSKRLDCLICGRDSQNRDNAVIIELKQWDKTAESDGDNEIRTWIGGKLRDILHPSVQVGQYRMYLRDYHSAFYDSVNPVMLSACAYLHNYAFDANDAIMADKFREAMTKNPLFTKDEVVRLKDFLKKSLDMGAGVDVLKRIENSKFRPSKQLMEHVAGVIQGNPEYTLLDEQLVVYDGVLTAAREGFSNGRKTVIIVRGGPGTGKSVIAINLMADLSRMNYNTQYATGSRAFTSTLREVLGKRTVTQLKFFNDYLKAQEENEVDVLIADESHRLWHKDISRWTPKQYRSDKPVIEHMIKAAKVLVFFVDDRQIIRPKEVGSTEYIQEYAVKNECNVQIYNLETQFRCKGSDAFVKWTDNTLGIERTANVMWTGEEQFDFRIMDSPEEVEQAIREKIAQGKKGRMVAGFCWPWSDPREDGTLEEDVVIDGYRRPWNAKPGKKKLAGGIPVSNLWASDAGGINQVGCVYTAQGFEFDYVGVIFGKDLTYNLDTQTWEGHPENSFEAPQNKPKDRFTDFVKNTYRILFSRGIEGCFVYFADKDTERFFKTRIMKKE